MAKNSIIHARVDEKLKEEVEVIFQLLGITTTSAISMFLQQVCFHQGLPFEVKLPNAQTVKAMEDVENGVDLTTCDSAEEMFEILDI